MSDLEKWIGRDTPRPIQGTREDGERILAGLRQAERDANPIIEVHFEAEPLDDDKAKLLAAVTGLRSAS